MANIKPYEEITVFETWDWEKIVSGVDIEKVDKAVQETPFINIWWKRRNIKNFKSYDRAEMWELDAFIYSQDNKIKKRLLKEKNNRKSKNLSTDVSNLINFAKRKWFEDKLKKK